MSMRIPSKRLAVAVSLPSTAEIALNERLLNVDLISLIRGQLSDKLGDDSAAFVCVTSV